jgi:hypothetical protein
MVLSTFTRRPKHHNRTTTILSSPNGLQFDSPRHRHRSVCCLRLVNLGYICRSRHDRRMFALSSGAVRLRHLRGSRKETTRGGQAPGEWLVNSEPDNRRAEFQIQPSWNNRYKTASQNTVSVDRTTVSPASRYA